MGDEIGPFHVEDRQIVRLGPEFTSFLTELLRSESTLNGQLAKITSTDSETIADGGVDVFIEDFTGTSDWIPVGSSVWQLKRGDYKPAEITKEFAKAAYARSKVEAGASYRLLLGVALPDKLVATRRKALLAAARAHGYIKVPEDEKRFVVITADKIASWATKYPAIALSPVLGGRGSIGIDFNTWSEQGVYATKWVSDDARNVAISSIRSLLLEDSVATIRVTGAKGVGKTHLVMEALRDPSLEPFVVYFSGDELTSEFLNNLVDRDRGRRAILVADDCPPSVRKKIEVAVQSNTGIKAIIIQSTDDEAPSRKVIPIGPMSRDHVEKILEANELVWREARTYVTEYCAGNIKTALWLCERIAEQRGGSTANFLSKDLIQDLIGGNLPDGQEYLAASLLSLLPRVGWDQDLESEIQLISGVFSVPMEVFANVEIKLIQLSVLEKEGRYRQVTPHPVACFFAKEAWRLRGDAIRRDFIPALTGKVELGFFERMADLGLFGETYKTIEKLLAQDPSFASLAALNTAGRGDLLPKMAIVAPELVLEHLAVLINAVSATELKDLKGIRRGLVDTLTKLVWNSRTFAASADSLLALALSENESWANNASGNWTGLFASVLPSTSASPVDRANYLASKVASMDQACLLLVVTAARKGLDPFESSMAYGELQNGVIVEPRGMPLTWSELYEYQKTMIDVLRRLAKHSDPEVVAAAQTGLVEAIHASLIVEEIRVALADAIIDVGSDDLIQLTNIEIRELGALFGSKEETFANRIAGLEDFKNRLPKLSGHERLMILARSNSWDFADGELCAELRDGFAKLGDEDSLLFLHEAFSIPHLPAAFDIGRALAEFGFDLLGHPTLLDKIIPDNLLVLTAFLLKRVEDGEISAFDEFFSGTFGSSQSPEVQYWTMMRAPITEVSWEKVSTLISVLPPAFVAANGIPWLGKMSEEQTSRRLEDLVSRLERDPDQANYNEVLDYASHTLHDKREILQALQAQLWRLLELRRQLPEVGRRNWAWSHIAKFLVVTYGEGLALLILDLIEQEAIPVHREGHEAKVLQKCAVSQPEVVFNHIASRLVAKSWRVSHSVRDWLTKAVLTEVIIDWIGDDITKAQVISAVCELGTTAPSALVEYLLVTFPGDDAIGSELYKTFYAGSWAGRGSDRLQAKIDILKEWLVVPGLAQEVDEWVRRVVRSLEKDPFAELEREEERGY